LEVVLREHAEEVDGGEVEELDGSVDEDAYAQGRKFVVCVGGHGCCVVAGRRRMDWTGDLNGEEVVLYESRGAMIYGGRLEKEMTMTETKNR